MPVRDELGKRMKKYESVSKTTLMRRTPVIIRIDGKAFHTFTRGFEKPFDRVLVKTMQETTKYLCQNIQGCVFGYTQSDEISLVLIDYQTLTTDAWFDYEVQKLCSIAASMATMAFNKFFSMNVDNFVYDYATAYEEEGKYGPGTKEYELCNTYQIAVEKGAMFDARAFNIPKEEVTNCIYWRQLDATRNSIQMVGQAHFSHNELHEKTCNQIQDMLHEQKGINWNNYPAYLKRGTAIVKAEIDKAEDEYGTPSQTQWFIDLNMPQLKGDDRAYLDKLIDVGV
jgi:tRNA(His) 5'-end guanylyltransferase